MCDGPRITNGLATGIDYRYNADGHLIEKGALQADKSLTQSGSIDHWRYRYNSCERLVEVQKNGQLLVKYAYNPLGQRISKMLLASKETTYYLYSEEGLVGESEEGLVGEYGGQGNLKQEYGYDPTAPWMSQPLFTRAQRRDTQAWSVSYFGTSHLGTPEVAFEKSGEVTWRAKAQAFGETHVTLNTIDNALRFPGQYFDQETGLYQNFFRDYDPQLGRYGESDPIGLRGGLNTFGYVGQNPLKYTDPSGLVVPAVAACATNPACVAIFYEGCKWAIIGITTTVTGVMVYEVLSEGVDDSCVGDCPPNSNSGDGQRPSKTPNEGEPGSKHVNPGSGQERWYGPDGKPIKDIDWDHDHGQGVPNVHDWGRDSNGNPTRGKGRPHDPSIDF